MLRFFLISCLIIVGCTKNVSFNEEQQASTNTINWLKTNSKFIESRSATFYLAGLTQRINLAIKQLALRGNISNKFIENVNWKILILEDKNANAFSIGAGNIILSRGLIRQLSTESELAAIITHEMAHQILGHINTELAKQKQSSEKTPAVVFSTENELDADRLGLKILKQSGFEPSSALTAFHVIFREYSRESTPPKWLETRSAYLFELINENFDGIPRSYDSRDFQLLRNTI